MKPYIYRTTLYLLILNTTFINTIAASIINAEYFIGEDPGEGNGNSISPEDEAMTQSLNLVFQLISIALILKLVFIM